LEFVIDIALIAVFGITVFMAYRKGLLKSFIDSFGLLISFFGAYKISGMISPWIYENLIKTKARSIIDEKISASDIAVSSQQIKEFFLSISDTIKEVLLKAGVDLAGISDKVSGIDLSSETAAELLEQTAVQPILTVVINCITFIVLAIIFIAVLFMLSNLITKTMSKTVLSGVNKFFGAVFGLVKGFIIVVLLVVVLLLVSAVIQNDVFDSMLASSKIIGLLR